MEKSHLYSVNNPDWRPFSFNNRKRQALTIMNLLLRRECTHPKEKFQTVLAELAVMLPVNSFNSQMVVRKRQCLLKEGKPKKRAKSRVIKTYIVADCIQEEAHCNYMVKHDLELFISLTEWSLPRL